MSRTLWTSTVAGLSVLAAAACAPAARTTPAAPPSPQLDANRPNPGSTGAAAGEVTGRIRATNVLWATGTRADDRAAIWAGSYGGGTQRRGALALRLRERAPGELAGELVLWVTPRADTFAPRAAARSLTVPLASVRDDGGRVVLATEPYYDAGCECTVTGTYRGVVRGDTLAGTYATSGAATAAGARGRWRVVRGATAAVPAATPASASSAATSAAARRP